MNMDDFIDNWRLKDIDIDELIMYFKPFELKVLLFVEDYTSDVDIMLENMLHYFLEYEHYDFACVIRDEVIRRELFKIDIKV